MTRLAALASVALLCLVPSAAAAQDDADAPPAHISFVDGAAVLERDGQTDTSPASMPLLAGDRIRTQAGRVEILFADGSALHVDNHSVIDFQSDEVVRLLDGRIRLSIAGQNRGVAYRVDAPAAWVQISETGEYRIAVLRGEREPQVELAVLRGAAELVNEDGRSLVRAGERAFARAGAQPSPPYVFNSAAWDAFDRWSESRRDQRLGVSAQYLPSDVRPYAAAFDHYGSWRYEQVHGYVWYPRVHVDWRPYYHGRWISLRPFGWTWIANDPWGWPTHHYGRWGFSSGAWFWIPGRRWGAAWVSWAYAPGYWSWCPLGWNDRPVFSFFNVNYYGGRRYDPWYGWTVVPRHHFGSGFVNVRVNVVAPARIDGRTRGAFVVRDSAPETRYAVPRASAPIRLAGTRTGYAIPRASTGTAVSAPDAPATGSPNFPGPAREPRTSVSRPSVRSSAPVTAAPQRAVPRDRGEPRDAFPAGSGVERRDGVSPGYRRAPEARAPDSSRPADPGSRRAPETRSPESGRPNPGSRRAPETRAPDSGRPIDAPSAAPPSGTRAVPRRGPGVESQPPAYSPERRDEAPVYRSAPRSAPDYRPDAGYRPEAGYRRAPDRGDAGDQYRAMPRQESRPPSYGGSPRPESRPPSYGGSPRPESRPPSYGPAPERRAPSPPSPSADRPSRSGPSGGDGQSRSRGDQPSRGQAVRRPGG